MTMKRLPLVWLIPACLSVATVASAQTVGQASPAPSRWSLGAMAGASAVQHVGGLLGGTIAWHQSRSLDVTADAVWLQDTVTRRRVDTADSLAAYLSQTQGPTVAAAIDAPAWALVGGVRWFVTQGTARFYIAANAGAARIALRPAITIAGTDITPRLADFGVSLGSDLTGASFRPAFGGGAGLEIPHGRWLVDVGARLFGVQTREQATNVIAVRAGFAYGF